MKRELTIRRGRTSLSASLETPEYPEGGKLPLVILMHALMMDRREPIFDHITGRLLERGIAVLRFDFSGHGRSGGRFEDMTLPLELEDGAAVLAYGESLPFVDGISLEDVAGATSAAPAAQGAGQAIAALVSLGYSQSEAAMAVSKIDATLPVEEIIKLALRGMAGRR